MKVIDLLNKIANGEEVPQMVSYEGKTYHIDELEHFYVDDSRKALLEYIFDYLNDFDALMTEIEIIEEDKKIEKIPYHFSLNYIDSGLKENTKEEIDKTINDIYNKINEIIDKINRD